MSAQSTATATGIGIGTALAAAMSWSIHHSLLYAWEHALCGWLYVFAYAMGWTVQWTP